MTTVGSKSASRRQHCPVQMQPQLYNIESDVLLQGAYGTFVDLTVNVTHVFHAMDCTIKFTLTILGRYENLQQ